MIKFKHSGMRFQVFAICLQGPSPSSSGQLVFPG